MARIGIYGGSFNPPHLGHIFAARKARQLLGLDKILLIPAAIPPHKAVAEGSPDGETRFALTQLAIAGETGMEVSRIELDRPGPSYTVDTLRELRESYPQDELYLLMGTDMFLSFSSGASRRPLQRWPCPSAWPACVPMQRFLRSCRPSRKKWRPYSAPGPSFCRTTVWKFRRPRPVGSCFRHCGRGPVPGRACHDRTGEALRRGRRISRAAVCGSAPRQPFSAQGKAPRPRAGRVRYRRAAGKKYGADETDAARAGILHDITKALSPAQQQKLVDHWKLPVSPFEYAQAKLLHAKTGAAAAARIFGENNAVVSAIDYHTTGRAQMTLLEKIIYIADYMEPNRDFPGVDRLREAVWRDLDEGVLLGIDMTLEQLAQKGQPACADSLAARDWLIQTRKEP